MEWIILEWMFISLESWLKSDNNYKGVARNSQIIVFLWTKFLISLNIEIFKNECK